MTLANCCCRSDVRITRIVGGAISNSLGVQGRGTGGRVEEAQEAYSTQLLPNDAPLIAMSWGDREGENYDSAREGELAA